MLDVRVNSALRDNEFGGDGAVSEPACDQLRNLTLAWSERQSFRGSTAVRQSRLCFGDGVFQREAGAGCPRSW